MSNGDAPGDDRDLIPGTTPEERERWDRYAEVAVPAFRILSVLSAAVLDALDDVSPQDWEAYGPGNNFVLPDRLWDEFLSKPLKLKALSLKLVTARFGRLAAEFCQAYDHFFPQLRDRAPTDEVENELRDSVFARIDAALRPLLPSRPD